MIDKKVPIQCQSNESIDAIKMYCDVIASVTKRLTNEGFNFLTGEYEKDKSVTK